MQHSGYPDADATLVSVSVSAARAPSRARIVAWAENALAELRPGANLDLKVVDEREMRELNARFRGQDRPTNVLAFPAELPPGVELEHLGDVVIAAPVVEREAEEYGVEPADRWAHLITHGVLHLLGFDHLEAEQAKRMEAEEVRILARLGIADPYR